jgi:hypothetical protein
MTSRGEHACVRRRSKPRRPVGEQSDLSAPGHTHQNGGRPAAGSGASYPIVLTRMLTTALDDPGWGWIREASEARLNRASGEGWTIVDGPCLTRNA